jgi:hypothetical protein
VPYFRWNIRSIVTDPVTYFWAAFLYDCRMYANFIGLLFCIINVLFQLSFILLYLYRIPSSQCIPYVFTFSIASEQAFIIDIRHFLRADYLPLPPFRFYANAKWNFLIATTLQSLVTHARNVRYILHGLLSSCLTF